VHDPTEIDPARLEKLQMFLREVGADHADDADGGEVAGRHGEVARRASQYSLNAARRRLDIIKRQRADD
jgi:hypothetical protein